MKIGRIVEALRKPGAYPHPAADAVEVLQTHISVVFLAGAYVYKIKKPVDLGFLDFTTLDRRLHFCREEVRLNRRLAPDVYLGVAPVTATDGGCAIDGQGATIEWAVKMRRLPDEATLLRRLRVRNLTPGHLEALGRRIATFHDDAESGAEIARFGRWNVVADNARENLSQTRDQIGVALSVGVRRRLQRALERELRRHRRLVEDRARRQVPRDTHGDLHLEHVYLFPDRPPPRDLVVIDCVEFNERFRYADPVSDMAFLAMDLLFRGRPDLEAAFSDAYFEAAGDREGRGLLPFYRSYRSAVRAKVEGITSGDPEVAGEERAAARGRARGHWLLALSELESPSSRPGLVLVGGLPGTGKSTLARHVGRAADFRVISTDLVRKELAGLPANASAAAGFEEGLYTPEWTRRTYDECLERARDGLFRGKRMLVDASFRREPDRRRFLEVGRESGVRRLLLWCRAPREVVLRRLERRTSGPSDADWEIYRQAVERWDEPAGDTARFAASVSTAGTVEESLREAIELLRRWELHD